jgi:hypothetical protein
VVHLTKVRSRRELYADGMDILHPGIEGSLLVGRGFQGLAFELRCLDDWRDQWDRWGDLLLEKCLEHRPGTRPFAMTVLGLIPSRPIAPSGAR